MELFKFSDSKNNVEWVWKNVYQREVLPNIERLVIGCKSKEIPLILDLCKSVDGPFGLLHVLLISRLENIPGRYQCPDVLSFDDLELFLYEHQEYFEQDGRQNLWVSSIYGSDQFIYDSHNFIYAYGKIEKHIECLEKNNFVEGTIKIPEPHCHNYHHQFDDVENNIMKKWNWIHHPLEDSDDP
jgi:hypothetical protein